MTLLSPFNQWEFSISRETGNSLFFQRCLQSLYLSWTPSTQSSLPFWAGIHISHNSIHVFNDGIKIRENRGLWTASLRKISNEELWQCTRQKTSEVDECFKLGTDWLLTQNKDQETSKGPHFNFTYKKIKPISTPLPQCKSHHTMKTKKS